MKRYPVKIQTKIDAPILTAEEKERVRTASYIGKKGYTVPKNQLSLITTSHRIDQETGAAFIVDVKPTNEYGVYNV